MTTTDSLIRSVTDASFAAEVLAAPGITLVEFWAEWCGPCRALGPVLEQVARDHSDVLRVVKINADDNPRTAAEYRALALPFMKMFRAGEPVGTIVGAKPRPAMEMALAPYLD
ncbi:thiol reductase thioredoxin [Leifsonia sp. ZF2019]|uniref:thioredoxin family protein n=1 Tax=Leifsonia sp. ZF2019 TaxID=2781978 RepID=UPI001CBF2541|nr:thioredoxin domain-containing protein [Leifsonia sp. ZF2019]UAJ77913.1 thiol reductase thioredoxin [Leifsonia sp. ZF2019]